MHEGLRVLDRSVGKATLSSLLESILLAFLWGFGTGRRRHTRTLGARGSLSTHSIYKASFMYTVLLAWLSMGYSISVCDPMQEC